MFTFNKSSAVGSSLSSLHFQDLDEASSSPDQLHILGYSFLTVLLCVLAKSASLEAVSLPSLWGKFPFFLSVPNPYPALRKKLDSTIVMQCTAIKPLAWPWASRRFAQV